jgi:hypothetical protein
MRSLSVTRRSDHVLKLLSLTVEVLCQLVYELVLLKRPSSSEVISEQPYIHIPLLEIMGPGILKDKFPRPL